MKYMYDHIRYGIKTVNIRFSRNFGQFRSLFKNDFIPLKNINPGTANKDNVHAASNIISKLFLALSDGIEYEIVWIKMTRIHIHILDKDISYFIYCTSERQGGVKQIPCLLFFIYMGSMFFYLLLFWGSVLFLFVKNKPQNTLFEINYSILRLILQYIFLFLIYLVFP